jgi:hypothetical protein
MIGRLLYKVTATLQRKHLIVVNRTIFDLTGSCCVVVKKSKSTLGRKGQICYLIRQGSVDVFPNSSHGLPTSSGLCTTMCTWPDEVLQQSVAARSRVAVLAKTSFDHELVPPSVWQPMPVNSLPIEFLS